MEKRDIVNIFTRFFNCVVLSIEDLIMIFLYYARERKMSLLKIMLLMFRYRDLYGIVFEVPPIISINVFRCLKKLINSGLLSILDGYVMLTDSGYRYVSSLVNKLRSCKYVVAGSLVKPQIDFIRDLSFNVSSIENSDVESVYKSSILNYVVDDLSCYDVLHLVRLVLDQVC
ncbi:MAG: hypothetical protein GXO10_01035 [Crenarchaeota archaeon]|nr:hypothetical protein [Thermoproteota archaeon]